MSEIAVLSDLIETKDEKEEIFFFTTTKKVKFSYIKINLPDGNVRYREYNKASGESSQGSLGLSQFGLIGTVMDGLTNVAANAARKSTTAAFEKRKEIIQEQINDLARQGYRVSEKYISLFMSMKIKELILRKDARPQRKTRT